MLAINQFVEKFSQKYFKQIAIAKALLLWQESVSTYLQKITRAKKIKENKIYIAVKENQWLFPLVENKIELIEKLNRKIIEKSMSIKILDAYFYYDSEFTLEEENNNFIVKNFLKEKNKAVKKIIDKNVQQKKMEGEKEDSKKIKNQIQQLKNYYQFYFKWQQKYCMKIGSLPEKKQQQEIFNQKDFYDNEQIDSFFLKNNDNIKYFEFYD